MSLSGRPKPIVDAVMAGERRTVMLLLKKGMTVCGVAQWMGVDKGYVARLIESEIRDKPSHND